MAMTLGLVVARPSVGPSFRITPALAAFLGVAILAANGVVGPDHFRYAVTNLRSPFIAIASIMVLTEIADRIGLLVWWASWVEARVTSTPALFLRVFALGVATSSLLNNDAAILVLTPVVLTMVRRRYPEQPSMLIPFAFAVFMSAGVAALPVSNPMNMVVAEVSGISFNTYARAMLPIAAVGWVLSYVSLRLLFAPALRVPPSPRELAIAPPTSLQRAMMVLVLVAVAAYPIVGAFGGPVWSVALTAAIIAAGLARHHPELGARSLLRRGVSWPTLGFLLAVLVMSLGLRDVGLVDRLAALYDGAGLATIGVTSALGSALLNNHPMSHLNMLALHGTPDPTRVLAALVGGDLGPRLLPMGSLAGLLWLEQLRRHGVHLRLGTFVRVGVVLAVPAIAASLAILAWG